MQIKHNLTAFFIFCCCLVQGQTLRIPLKSKLGDNNVQSNIIPTTAIRNYKANESQEKYKGFDETKYRVWNIRTFVFSSAQQQYENSRSSAEFTAYAKSMDIDTTLIAHQTILKNKAAVFVGIDSAGLKHVVVDTNNDRDFSNDKIYTYSSGAEKNYPIVKINFDYYDGEHIKSAQIPLFLDVYGNYIGAKGDEAKLQVNFIKKAYKEGTVQIKGKRYVLQLSDEYFSLYKNKMFMINIRQIPLDTTDNNNYRYSSKDLLTINKFNYKIDSLSGDVLCLTYKGQAIYDGGKPNTMAINVMGRDLMNGKFISLKQKKGRYVLLDFWGSWCGPCIAAIPHLKAIHNKYSTKGLEVIGIANDDLDDLPLLKKIISDKELKWGQLHIDRNKPENALNDYKINQFPTSILIDPYGKIVARGVGARALTTIELYLYQLYK